MSDEKKDPPSPVVWPEVGSRWKDNAGRTLVIEALQKHDGRERNIIGKVDGVDYATSMRIFEVIWKPIDAS